MRYTTGLIVLGILLTLNTYADATPYQVPSNWYDIAPASEILVVNDLGDTNDAYAAVTEWGPKYALASIQGTHSWVDATSHYQYGFTVQGASSVEVEIEYTLLAELYSQHQATVTSRALIGIYEYHQQDGYPYISLKSGGGMPIWSDQVTRQIVEPLDQIYDLSGEKLSAVDTLTLTPRWQWGRNFYMVEVYAQAKGLDTHQIQYTAGTYENPDAWYSAAAYADPIFTVLTEGASLTELAVTQQTSSMTGGDLGQPPILRPGNTGVIPEPSTILMLGTGLLGVVGIARRRKS